jgi:hypothetical protein
VLLVAVVAIGVILLMAFAISRFGGDDATGGLLPPGEEQVGVNGDTNGAGDASPIVENTPATATDDAPPVGQPEPSGVVPAVEGQTEEAAIAAIEEAGLLPNIRYEPHEGEPGIVLHQSPDAGTEREPGDPMTIIVSEAP